MKSQSTIQVRYSSVHEGAVRRLNDSAGAVLDMSLAQSNAEGGYVYRIDLTSEALDLVLWRGLPPVSGLEFRGEGGLELRKWLSGMAPDVVLESGGWRDGRLAQLPEFIEHRFEAAIVLPLLRDNAPRGLFHFAKRARGSFAPQAADMMRALRAPLADLIAAAFLHEEKARLEAELQKMGGRLAGRKNIERAKGILQARNNWTEEEAYLHLRQLSRRTRRSMSDISRQLLSTAPPRPSGADCRDTEPEAL